MGDCGLGIYDALVASRPGAIGSATGWSGSMKFSGELTVEAPRDQVFERLRDAKFFGSCVEGVRDFAEVSENCYSAVFETKVAFMRFKFQVQVEIIRVEKPQLIEAKIEGKPLGIVGRLSAKSVTTLVERGAETVICYEVEAGLTGKLGSLGQPVLNSKAKELERQFITNLRSSFAANVGGIPA